MASVVIAGAYYATLLLHPAVHLTSHSYWNYVAIYPSLLLLGHGLFFLASRGHEKWLERMVRHLNLSMCLWRITQGLGVMGFTLFMGIVLTKDHLISRNFLLTLFPVLWVALALSTLLLRKYGLPRLFGGRYHLNTLLIADVISHDPLIDWLEGHKRLGLKLSWVFSSRPLPEDYGHFDPGMPGAQVEEVIRLLRPSVVICSGTHLPGDRVAGIRRICEEQGGRFVLHISQVNGLGGLASVYSDSGHAVAVFRQEPLESPFGRLLKRLFDLAIATPMVLCVLPVLCVVVKLIHRRQSPGPLFYSQVRAGAGSHTFRVYKFRTMHCDHGRDGEQATQNDDRVFPAGRLLRKYSIDEFPQFLNVLHGDMSVVGPRPHYLDHDAQFADFDPLYRFRKLLKPGITGLSQIEGYRGQTHSRGDVRVRSYTDLAYLENWSLSLDFSIVIRTFWHLVRPPKSAH